MIALALVPLVVGVLAAVAAHSAARLLAPAAATVLLTALALTVSLAIGLVLCLAAYVGASELIPIRTFRSWSADVLRDNIPMPPAAGLAAGAVAIVLLGSASFHLGRVVAHARSSAAVAAALPARGDLVVVRDASVFAYAVPGRPGRIVTSTGTLTALSGPQRRALLAHEAAHLRYHHHVYVQLARLAAAANPLMRPVSKAVDACVERWADAAAVRAVGDRRTVAQAVAAAALAQVPRGSLPAAGGNVVERVRLLLEPTPRHRPIPAALAAAVVACWASVLVLVLHVHALVEIAQAAGLR